MHKEENRIRFYQKENIEIVQGNSYHSFPKHSHDCFCVGIVTAGTARFILNSREYVLSKNSVYFVPPFTEHTILAIDKKPYSYQVACVADIFEVGEGNTYYKSYVFNAGVGKTLLAKFEHFNNAHDSRRLYDALALFIKANVNSQHVTTKRRSIEFVQGLAVYIREHPDEPFSLYKLCELSHLTRFYLLRAFKEQMGVTPYQFYIQEKIRKIRQGLLADQSAINLACDLKFTDQSHMCNTFKKHVGLTPKQFQKSCECE